MAINKKFISDHKRGPERGLGALAPIPEDSNQFLNPTGQSSTAPTPAPKDWIPSSGLYPVHRGKGEGREGDERRREKEKKDQVG